MNKEVNDNLNKNTSQEDIEFLTTAVPIIKDLNNEQIEMLTTSLPVIKDYTEEEINELIKKIPTLKKEDIAKIKDALKPVEKQSNKEKIIDLLKTKRSKLLIILGILIIILTVISVGTSFALSSQNEEYENYFFEIDKKENPNMEIYNIPKDSPNFIKDSKASQIVSCMQSNTPIEKLPESVTSVINEINDYYNKSINRFAYKYVDIYTGFTVSYNENQHIFTASTIKAPTDIYIYENAENGSIDLEEKLLYTKKYYNPGAGYIKLGEENTYYTVRELVKNSAYYSDNVAHTMLMDKFNKDDMLAFWKAKGTNAIFTRPTIWGETSAHDAAIYMNELYNFYEKGSDIAKELMSYFTDNGGQFLIPPQGLTSANKSGCAGSVMHDISIVFDENPYIVIALSNLGCLSAGSYFEDVSNLTYKLHKAYWDYKVSSCINK